MNDYFYFENKCVLFPLSISIYWFTYTMRWSNNITCCQSSLPNHFNVTEIDMIVLGSITTRVVKDKCNIIHVVTDKRLTYNLNRQDNL